MRSGQTAYLAGSALYLNPPQASYVVPYDPRTLQAAGNPLLGHASSITRVESNEAAGFVAAASGDGTVKVWNQDLAEQIGTMTAESDVLQFGSSGTRLLIGHRDHVSIWNYDMSTWADIACEYAHRNLSRAEWERLGPSRVDFHGVCAQYAVET